jgi:hypothetical protein
MTPEDSEGSATTEPEQANLRGLAGMATQNARTFAEEGKETTARQIGSVASAIRGAARELEGQMPKGAELVRSAAATLESGAEKLRQRSVEEWLQSVRRFAHDEPVALFGGAILAGFAVSRFLNSSRARSSAGDNRS